MHRRSVRSYSLTTPRNEHPQPACFLGTGTADLNNVVGVLYCTSHLHPAPCELRGNLPLNLFGSNDTMEVEHRKLFVNVLQMFAYICNLGLNTTQMKSSPAINPLWPYWPSQSMWLPVRLAQCLLLLSGIVCWRMKDYNQSTVLCISLWDPLWKALGLYVFTQP